MNKIIFSNIIEKYKNQYILKWCTNLNKKLSLKSIETLETINLLGTYMYIQGDYNNAIDLFCLTDSLKFNGNWNIWNEVYDSQILKARVFNKLGKADIAEQTKKDLNLKTTGGILNWKSNINSACTIPMDERINVAIKEGLSKHNGEFVFRMKLFKLIWLLKFIEGSVFIDDFYNKKILEAEALIKEIKEIGN